MAEYDVAEVRLDLVSSDLTVIVLAAGGGTRMRSKTAKVLHEIAGRSTRSTSSRWWVTSATRSALTSRR